jgi:ABC-type taurine transport system substrate-binding protein
MVEKDYGEQFIEPAKAFIEQINQTFEEYQMRTQPQQMDTEEFDDMRRLAGLH